MAEMDKRLPSCDACGKELGCLDGDPRLKGYWQLEVGVRYCDPCLLQHSDDFPEREETERLFAIRLRHVRGVNIEAIEAKACEARGVIIPEQANRPLSELGEALKLFRAGERLAAMATGQAAWNTANSLHIAIVTSADVVNGQRATEQRARAGFSSGEQRRAERSKEWKQWQAAAEAIYAANKNQSKSEVCNKVAVRFGVSSRAVANRVNGIGKERRRSN